MYWIRICLLMGVLTACSESLEPPADSSVPDSSPDSLVTTDGVSGGQPADNDASESETDSPTPSPWTLADCSLQSAGTGVKAGDIAFDFVQPDQFGNSLRLHDFCDRTILLVGSAFW